jgi:hypothetical protein
LEGVESLESGTWFLPAVCQEVPRQILSGDFLSLLAFGNFCFLVSLKILARVFGIAGQESELATLLNTTCKLDSFFIFMTLNFPIYRIEEGGCPLPFKNVWEYRNVCEKAKKINLSAKCRLEKQEIGSGKGEAGSWK